MNQCIKCGGSMVGDGYTSVMYCEFAVDPDLDYMAPDEGPVYCDFEEEDSVLSN